jgi:NAD(P)-dependent dehydrogenase (short-subunit alcohol dehydrogenase family)
VATGTAEMTGKTCMVTGATGGIGLASAVGLARLGARLVLVCRSLERGRVAAQRIREEAGSSAEIDLLEADLASQAAIRALAARYLASERPLHVLLNNAGVVMLKRNETPDGIETTFAVNHLAYFLLTNLLMDALKRSAPARIVCVASDAHRLAGGPLDFDDLEGRKRYAAMRNYGMSKLANILFTRALAKRLLGSDVTATCMHPGFVRTNFGANNDADVPALIKRLFLLISRFARTPEKGAETVIYLASSSEVQGASGGYYLDCKLISPSPAAQDNAVAEQLWQVSEKLVGIAD